MLCGVAMTAQFDSPIHMMEVQGGSFVKALAALYLRADPANRPRVLAAFPEYFGDYDKRFKLQRLQKEFECGACDEPGKHCTHIYGICIRPKQP